MGLKNKVKEVDQRDPEFNAAYEHILKDIDIDLSEEIDLELYGQPADGCYRKRKLPPCP
jgi:hypothetical protein